MALIKMPVRSNRQTDSAVVKKSKNKKFEPVGVKGGTDIMAVVNQAVAVAELKLGKYAQDYILIRDEDNLINYFSSILENGICAIDTETTSLNPITTTLVGVCLYTPNCKPAYIPVNHISYITQARTKNQLTESDILKQLSRCNDVKWIMHNAKFDIRVIKNQVGIKLNCYWDTMLAAKCLNENESAALKNLHLKYCKSKDTEALTYESLFSGIPFSLVPIKTAYLYAAGDAIKTFELYEFQKQHLNRRKLPGPYKVFTELEMGVLPVVCDMEDTGITLDVDFCNELSEKYTSMKQASLDRFYSSLEPYADKIAKYRSVNPNKLDDPIKISSSTQMAVLLYDIMGLVSPDTNKPRGTGEDIISQFDTEVASCILEYRGIEKLLSTYIDKMPTIMLEDGKIHCSFNQYGAATGRFSSDSPNMQNIPSHNKEIRRMFRASDGCVLVGSDFSQQEPRVLAYASGDKNMREAYLNGKDIYAWIASFIYHVPYEDCKEFFPDGTTNSEGKKRRQSVKNVILGLMYGRGTKAIADQLNCSVKEAQKVVDKFFNSFPSIQNFVESTQNNAHRNGYVETVWGRKRRLPDMLLDDYEFNYIEGKEPVGFDPLDFNAKLDDGPKDVDVATKKKYTKLLSNAYGWKAKQNIINQAINEGISIKDNGGKIADASRQCVNSIIQGTSADITKYAMIAIGKDEKLNELGFKLLLQVHDEVIGECPRENAKQCADRLCEVMVNAALDIVDIPMKCDAEITECWYGPEVEL